MRTLMITLLMVIPLSMASNLSSLITPKASEGNELEQRINEKYDLVANSNLKNLNVTSNCDPPLEFDFESINDGEWTESGTWKNGMIPPKGDVSAKSIKISHHVVLDDSNIKLKDGAVLYVVGRASSFTVRNGNMNLEGQDSRAIFLSTDFMISSNVELNEFTSLCMTDVNFWVGEEAIGPDFTDQVSSSGNFDNKGGYRLLENVCGNVTGNFTNEGTDIILNTCMDVGDRGPLDKEKDGSDSGNFQHNGGTMDITSSEFYVCGNIKVDAPLIVNGVDYRTTNGNFKNSGSITGSDLVIWIDYESGNMKSDGNWDGSIVTLWRMEGENSIEGIPNLPPESTLDEIRVHFNCGCDPDPLASIGDFTWLDKNKDGIQNNNEVGLEGIYVRLYSVSGRADVMVDEMSTDADGHYVFDDLIPGDYYLTFEYPDDYTMCDCDMGDDDEIDSDIGISGIELLGQTPVITLRNGEHNMTVDGGFYESSLPVDFGSLEVRVVGQDVILTWTTYTELNSEGFHIERSEGGIESYNELAYIPGVGNSTKLQSYQFTDSTPKMRSSYLYRVKYIGMDGEVSYSDEVMVRLDVENQLIVYPNPSRGLINVHLPDFIESPLIQVYDAIGRKVVERRPVNANHIQPIDLSDLDQGIYMIVLRMGKTTLSTRVILVE